MRTQEVIHDAYMHDYLYVCLSRLVLSWAGSIKNSGYNLRHNVDNNDVKQLITYNNNDNNVNVNDDDNDNDDDDDNGNGDVKSQFEKK